MNKFALVQFLVLLCIAVAAKAKFNESEVLEKIAKLCQEAENATDFKESPGSEAEIKERIEKLAKEAISIRQKGYDCTREGDYEGARKAIESALSFWREVAPLKVTLRMRETAAKRREANAKRAAELLKELGKMFERREEAKLLLHGQQFERAEENRRNEKIREFLRIATEDDLKFAPESKNGIEERIEGLVKRAKELRQKGYAVAANMESGAASLQAEADSCWTEVARLEAILSAKARTQN